MCVLKSDAAAAVALVVEEEKHVPKRIQEWSANKHKMGGNMWLIEWY